MTNPQEQRLKVFYSWQSDLPDAANRKLIRNALNEAATEINANHDLNLHLVIDEATRDVPGSPDIADSIFAKIRESDVFVCDLTKVAGVTNEAGKLRMFCNPNVAIELGYAIRMLGWDRIILVFNEAYGTVPGDLPFDTGGHRATTYKCKSELNDKGKPTSACESQISSAKGQLRATLVDALKLIAKDNPKRPSELEAESPDQIKRERDVEQLRKVFRYINLPLMDKIITSVAEGRMLYVSEAMYQGLAGVLDSSSFHITDAELLKRICAFAKAWSACFKYALAMEPDAKGKGGYFKMPGDRATSAEQHSQFVYTCRQSKPLRESLDLLLEHVRQHYLVIDPTHTGEEELKAYLDEEQRVNERMKSTS